MLLTKSPKMKTTICPELPRLTPPSNTTANTWGEGGGSISLKYQWPELPIPFHHVEQDNSCQNKNLQVCKLSFLHFELIPVIRGEGGAIALKSAGEQSKWFPQFDESRQLEVLEGKRPVAIVHFAIGILAGYRLAKPSRSEFMQNKHIIKTPQELRMLPMSLSGCQSRIEMWKC